MRIATKFLAAVALATGLGLAAVSSADAQYYTRYASYGDGYYGGYRTANYMDRASRNWSGGGY